MQFIQALHFIQDTATFYLAADIVVDVLPWEDLLNDFLRRIQTKPKLECGLRFEIITDRHLRRWFVDLVSAFPVSRHS